MLQTRFMTLSKFYMIPSHLMFHVFYVSNTSLKVNDLMSNNISLHQTISQHVSVVHWQIMCNKDSVDFVISILSEHFITRMKIVICDIFYLSTFLCFLWFIYICIPSLQISFISGEWDSAISKVISNISLNTVYFIFVSNRLWPCRCE